MLLISFLINNKCEGNIYANPAIDLNFWFSLHLKQWQISKQLNSLIEVRYAQIKRNPE
jgi:hypothetical protein